MIAWEMFLIPLIYLACDHIFHIVNKLGILLYIKKIHMCPLDVKLQIKYVIFKKKDHIVVCIIHFWVEFL